MNRRLKEHRESAKLDISSIAEKSGVSRAQIVALEEENARAFSSKLVYRMAEKKLLRFYDREKVRKSKDLQSIPPFLRS